MKTLLAVVVGLGVLLSAPAPAVAQGNDNDYTPLNSRIRRDRQFPLDLPSRFDPARMTAVMRERSKDMLIQLSRCLYNRSNEQSLELLERTDAGFTDFRQIGLDPDRAVRTYGFRNCLRRVATSNNTGVQLRFSPGALRQWLLQQAYLDRYPNGPTWITPGNVIAERVYPLSQNLPAVRNLMDFADCVIQTDPYGADYFFRAPPGSAEERTAMTDLVPALGPCLPQGVRMEIEPVPLRVWLGEALWHAAAHSAPAGGPTQGAAQ